MFKLLVPKPYFIAPEKLDPKTRGVDKSRYNLTSELTFVNNTGLKVYLYTRDGIVTEFPPGDSRYMVGSEAFEIHKEIGYLGVRFNVTTPMDHEETYQGNLEKEVYKKQLEFDVNSEPQFLNTKSTRFSLFKISQAKLMACKSMHITNLDIVVSTLGPETGMSHPLTFHGDCYRLLNDMVKETNLTELFSFNILFVDNSDDFGDRFINISGKTIKLHRTKSSSHTSGFYVFDLDGKGLTPPRFYETEEDLKVKEGILVFRSKDESDTGGNPKSIYEGEVLERKKEIDYLKHKNELESLDYKKKLDIMNNEFKEKEFHYKEAEAKHKREYEELSRKYREAADARAKLYDSLKMAGTIIGGIASAVTAFIYAYKSSNSK